MFIFLNENLWISIEIPLQFVPTGPINTIPALVQIIAWHRSSEKPLYEAMMVSLLTHICVTQPQSVCVMTLPCPKYDNLAKPWISNVIKYHSTDVIYLSAHIIRYYLSKRGPCCQVPTTNLIGSQLIQSTRCQQPVPRKDMINDIVSSKCLLQLQHF